MTNELTADDLVPIIAKLSQKERMRLMRLAFQANTDDSMKYAANPVRENEFSSDEDPLAWDAAGWEDVE